MTKNNEIAVVQQPRIDSLTHQDVGQSSTIPVADLYETPESFVILIDLPGANKDAIRISMEGGMLTVHAHVSPFHEEHATVLHRELRTTSYHRLFKLGSGIDRQRVDAQFEQGVLTVRLPKNEKARTKEISIQ